MQVFILNYIATVFGLLVHAAIGFIFLLLYSFWIMLWVKVFGIEFTVPTLFIISIPVVPIWIWFAYRYMIPAMVSVSWGFWAETFAGNKINPNGHLRLVRESAQIMWQDLVILKGKVLG